MTPKQRFISSINFQQPDDMVAFMELELHIYEELSGKKPVICFDFEKLSQKEKEAALYKNAEIMVEIAEKAGHDSIGSIFAYWEISPGIPSYLWLREEADQLGQIRALKKVAGDKYFIIGTACATMGMPGDNSIYEFVTNLYENPEDFKKTCEAVFNHALESQRKQLEAGADGIINCCDVAFNSGPFMSPVLMDEFFFPYFNRWVESLKSQGIISIWHTDGNVLPIMDRIIESGVNAIQCVDPLGGMDIVEVKKQVRGKLALIGNIDCSLLQLGSKQEIEAETKRVVEGCKEGGGFVLSGCNAIFRGIPVENYMAMVEARRKFGRY